MKRVNSSTNRTENRRERWKNSTSFIDVTRWMCVRVCVHILTGRSPSIGSYWKWTLMFLSMYSAIEYPTCYAHYSHNIAYRLLSSLLREYNLVGRILLLFVFVSVRICKLLGLSMHSLICYCSTASSFTSKISNFNFRCAACTRTAIVVWCGWYGWCRDEKCVRTSGSETNWIRKICRCDVTIECKNHAKPAIWNTDKWRKGSQKKTMEHGAVKIEASMWLWHELSSPDYITNGMHSVSAFNTVRMGLIGFNYLLFWLSRDNFFLYPAARTRSQNTKNNKTM